VCVNVCVCVCVCVHLCKLGEGRMHVCEVRLLGQHAGRPWARC
jgi:hypothetical protein